MIELIAEIHEVYKLLQERKRQPSGAYDNSGRWYSDRPDLINVRSPSRTYPLSELAACRTKKYVKRVVEKYNCKTKQDILDNV